jgi:hypothetical protein
MKAYLAGLLVKRVCIFGQPVPGVRPGSTRTPRICDTEPTLLLVVLVAGILAGAIAITTALVLTRRRQPATDAPARPGPASAPQPVHTSGTVARSAGDGDGQPGRNWRDVYARLLAFVDRATADVERTMPDERSMPVRPPRLESEESSTLAAELTVLGSAHVHDAHAAWSRALFQFYLLARDVADAGAQNLPEEQYRNEVLELRRTRSTVIEMADALRRQAAQELRAGHARRDAEDLL